MTGFLALELRRSLRDVRYLIIAVAMPIGLYLLFTGLFGAHSQRAQGLPQPVELMIAMIAYGAMWAGVVPLALLGLAIGYLAGDEIAFPLTMALYFALGALGGLWIPLSVMPHVMQGLAQSLPSNGVAELGWRIAGGQAPVPKAVLVLTVWLLGSAAAALLAYRRRGTRSAH